MDTFAPLIAAAIAFGVAVGPVAAAVTKAVDLVRNATDKLNTKPKWVWNVTAGVFSILAAVLFQLNFIGPVVLAIPALAESSSHLTGVAGQVLTGLGIMGFSGYWHEKFSMWSAASDIAQVEQLEFREDIR